MIGRRKLPKQIPAKERRMRLAFCITVKNRSRCKVDYEDSTPFLQHAAGKIEPSPYPTHTVELEDGKLVLPLLPKMLRSLVALKRPEDDWVIVVTDFQSTDANVAEVLYTEVGEKVPWTVHRITDWPWFDRGGGLKKAAEIAETKYNADAVFFMDADLEFKSREIVDWCYTVLEKKLFFYPIFFAFADPLHERGFWRDTSYGNFAGLLSEYKKTAGWMHNISWGWEDRALADSIATDYKARMNVPGFCHQWHPMQWDFRVSEYPVKDYLFKQAAVSQLPEASQL